MDKDRKADRHISTSTITVRVPKPLKALIESRARKRDIYTNEWVLHALIKYTEYKDIPNKE